MHPPHGPLKVGVNRQITLPSELLGRIDVAPGDSVYVSLAEETDNTLLVIPVKRLISWIDAGQGQQAVRDPIKGSDSR